MRQLNLAEIQAIAGADVTVKINAHVESGVASSVTYLLSQLVNGQFTDTNSFVTALSGAMANGANFDEVRVTDIEFYSFN